MRGIHKSEKNKDFGVKSSESFSELRPQVYRKLGSVAYAKHQI